MKVNLQMRARYRQLGGLCAGLDKSRFAQVGVGLEHCFKTDLPSP
jgi:hypothetical protein